jgi:single-strand DNA-binding protein
LSYLPSQTPVVEFGLAVNRNWKGQDGQQREETCFIDCRAYGRQAETINQYLGKGSQALVEGRLQFDTWEGKDGTRRSKHRVFVERCQFLGSPSGRTGQRPQAAAPPPPAPAPGQAPLPPPSAPRPGGADLEEPPQQAYDEEPPPPAEPGEDIPF